MQPDLPEPVVPAMRRCGMRARSVQTALPEMSLPSQTESGLAVAGRSPKMSPSVTSFGERFGTSTPDRLLARDRCEDADLGRRERVAQVVLQARDLRHLRAGCELQLVAGHARAGDLSGHGRIDSELGERAREEIGGLRARVALRRRDRGRRAQEVAIGEPVLGVFPSRSRTPTRRFRDPAPRPVRAAHARGQRPARRRPGTPRRRRAGDAASLSARSPRAGGA